VKLSLNLINLYLAVGICDINNKIDEQTILTVFACV